MVRRRLKNVQYIVTCGYSCTHLCVGIEREVLSLSQLDRAHISVAVLQQTGVIMSYQVCRNPPTEGGCSDRQALEASELNGKLAENAGRHSQELRLHCRKTCLITDECLITDAKPT